MQKRYSESQKFEKRHLYLRFVFRYLNEYNRVLNLPKTLEKMSQFTELMDKLTKLTGKKIEKPSDMYYLYHTFIAQSSMNLLLPKWAYDYFPDGLLFNGTVAAYNIANSTPLLRRLFAGKSYIQNFIIITSTIFFFQHMLILLQAQ